MKKTALLASVAGMVSMVMGSAHAFDGQIDFTGSVSDTTCTLSALTKNQTVTMDPISKTALVTPETAAGHYYFALDMDTCSPTTTTGATPVARKVAVSFEGGPLVDAKTGRLKLENQAVAGAATNVQIGIFNKDGKQIMIGKDLGNSNSLPVDIQANGTAKLEFTAAYVATDGAATAGNTKAKVTYVLAYP